MFLDANQVDQAFYDEMKQHWSEAQIMELGAFIAFHFGMAMFMRSLGAAAVEETPEPAPSGHCYAGDVTAVKNCAIVGLVPSARFIFARCSW